MKWPDTGVQPARLIATLAHELRGPLHALGTSTALLAEDLDEMHPEQVRDMAHAIHRRTMWLQGLVENVMCVAAIEHGGLSIHLQPADLVNVIEDVQLMVEPLLVQRNQWLRLHLPLNPTLALADRRRLGQAVLNLVLNASKFSDSGTEIDTTLAGYPADRTGNCSWWRITVEDRGEGLPPGGTERLFAPYVRGEHARSLAQEGLGLGLSIVRSVAEAHDGRVGAEPREGGGARFWIDLPALAAT